MPQRDAAVVDARSTTRVAALDGVRGAAIFIVLVHNAGFVLRGSTAVLPKIASAITVTGWIGVQLFFVLSGFLITGILMDARGSPRFFRTFYLRRTLRIFPLYYIFLAAAFLLVPLAAELPSWSATAHRNQWWYWLYASNWGSPLGHDVPGLSHFWSLAVEEQFYVVWPLVVFLLSGRALIGLCVTIIVTAPLARWILHTFAMPVLASYEFTFARWDALAFGAVLAIVLRDGAGRAWLARRAGPLAATALAALGLLVLVERGFHEDDVAVQIAGQSLVAALFAWVIYASSAPVAGGVRAGLSAPWLRFLGKYSYAIYVFHYPIHRIGSYYFSDAVNGADTNWRLLRLAGYVGAVAATSIVAAVLSWRLLEKPFLDLKDKLAPRSTHLAGTTL